MGRSDTKKEQDGECLAKRHNSNIEKNVRNLKTNELRSPNRKAKNQMEVRNRSPNRKDV